MQAKKVNLLKDCFASDIRGLPFNYFFRLTPLLSIKRDTSLSNQLIKNSHLLAFSVKSTETKDHGAIKLKEKVKQSQHAKKKTTSNTVLNKTLEMCFCRKSYGNIDNDNTSDGLKQQGGSS